MDERLVASCTVQDLTTPDATKISASTYGTGTHTHIYVGSGGAARIGGSDGGSRTLTDQDYHRHFRETHIYQRRWWVLSMLCISVMQNSNNWISFSVCYDETHEIYGWDKSQVDMLTAYGPLLFIPTAIFLPYLNKIFTFRALMTISNLLMCIGAVIRSFPPKSIPNHSLLLILAHFGQILNAIAAPMVYCTPQQLSSIWFPKHERTTATSIAVVSGYAGSLISYLTIYYINTINHRLLTVLRLEAVFSLIFFIIVLSDQIWYNDIPPIPPSVSSMLSLEKHHFSHGQTHSFKQEFMLILRNRKFQYFTFICGVYQGVISGWIGILDTIFGPNYIGFTETYVAVIGISTILAIIVSGIIFGAINDKLHKRMKFMIITLLFMSGLFLSLFTILVNSGNDGSIHFIQNDATSKFLIIMFCVIGVFCNAGTYGLTYEASVELIYPSREVFAGSILTIYFNLFSSIFILLNNYLSPLFMNWIVSIIQLISCLLLLFYNQEYRRSDTDDAAARSIRSRSIRKTPNNTKSINNDDNDDKYNDKYSAVYRNKNRKNSDHESHSSI